MRKRRAAALAALATSQSGRITFAQLRALGFSADHIRGWVANHVVVRTVPRVYALGYPRSDVPARFWEAVLYAGPGASLTGAAGAYQCELIRRLPAAITVSSPRQCRSRPGIVVRPQRPAERRMVDGVPVAPLTELMLDLAAEVDDTQVRFALGNLDFRRRLDIGALHGACRPGRPGSRQLRHALDRHMPQLAKAKSGNEIAFLLLLEAAHLPLPEVNVWVHGVEVDAYFRALKLAVEIDTDANHGTAAQQRKDAGRTQRLNAHGVTVIRFDDTDLRHRIPETLAALAAHGVIRGAAR